MAQNLIKRMERERSRHNKAREQKKLKNVRPDHPLAKRYCWIYNVEISLYLGVVGSIAMIMITKNIWYAWFTVGSIAGALGLSLVRNKVRQNYHKAIEKEKLECRGCSNV